MAKKSVKQVKARKTSATKEPVEVKQPQAAEPSGLAVTVDFPQQDEGVNPGGYTLRIGIVPEAVKVEVSIDRGPWLTCRQAEGYWWYDWSDYLPGVHRVTARAMGADGVSGVSQQRRFQVVPA